MIQAPWAGPWTVGLSEHTAVCPSAAVGVVVRQSTETASLAWCRRRGLPPILPEHRSCNGDGTGEIAGTP